MESNSLPPILQSALARKLPPKIDYGIAFVGCGGIVNYGHIPAYKASRFHIVGGYDRACHIREREPWHVARRGSILSINERGAQCEPIGNHSVATTLVVCI